ncbi:lysylphosphatidylglycerol synthase transmembrane domain-containing protein [Phytohabitans rumicis]|nr:lysylphosphatidylglycerol synthase transmembrane domain-containing protein [Phytohabitans rumicis]
MAAARRWRRWRLPLMVAVAVAGMAVVFLSGRLPDPRELLTALAGAEYGWVALAALLQAVSLAAFAYQERRVLAAMGVRLRHGQAMSITLTRAALAIALPAGAAVATGYAVREYRRAGGTREIGAATAVVSGIAAIGGLTILYVGGGAIVVAEQSTTFLSWQPLAVVAALTALTFGGVALGRRMSRWSAQGGRVPRYLRRPLAAARDAWQAGAALRGRDWAAALAYATVNWLADLLCFAAATRAFGLPISLVTLGGIYLAVQVVRQVPLTPGGAGVVETTFVAGLTAAGATAIPATAAVLVYRLLSCWLLIPIGGAAALTRRPALRRGLASPRRSVAALRRSRANDAKIPDPEAGFYPPTQCGSGAPGTGDRKVGSEVPPRDPT